MRHDPQLQAVLGAYFLPIERATWAVDGAGCRPEVTAYVADSVGLPTMDKTDDPGPARRRGVIWDRHLRQALGHLVFGHCVDDETEALTRRGWLPHDQLRAGDELLTLNPQTGLSEWQPCTAVNRFDGTRMVRRLEGRSHSSVTTLNHKWVVRKNSYERGPAQRQRKTRRDKLPELVFTTTAQLGANDEIVQAVPCVTLPAEPKYADAFVSLAGWLLAEGSYYPEGKFFALWQSERVNPRHCASIRSALQQLYGPASASMSAGQKPAADRAPMYRETFRRGRFDTWCWRMNRAASDPFAAVFVDPKRKIIAPEFVASLTEAQLRLFVDAAMAGDGHVSARGQRIFTQKYRDRLDAVAMACALLGIPTTIFPASGPENWALALRHRTRTRPAANARRSDNRRSFDVTEMHAGTVWCPTVPNRTWLARRRGTVYYTGNSVFERRYAYDPDAGLMRLDHLGQRMPWTIAQMHLNRDGTIAEIEQITQAEPIVARRLVWYVNGLEGSNWAGISKLRPAFGPWLLKHEMWRTHATSSRRFGMGVPTVTAPPGATAAQVTQAQQLAASMRVGDQSGAGLPSGFAFELAGLRGTVPDTLKFIEYLDGQMSKMALAGLIDMPMAAHGSKALGETVLDLFLLSLQSVADDIAVTATSGQDGIPGIVTDLVDLNWGPGEPCPRIVCADVGESHELTAEAIGMLVQYGALQPDAALDSWIRKVWKLPARTAPIPAAPGQEPPKGVPADPGAAPGTLPAAQARAGELRAAAPPGAFTPGRELTDAEKRAGFDPGAVHADFAAAMGAALAAWPPVEAEQRDQIVSQVAAGKVAALRVDTSRAAGILQDAMAALARQAAAQAVTEAAHQGVLINPDAVKISPVSLGRVAAARAAQAGAYLAQQATRRVLQVRAAAPGDPADLVAGFLAGLSVRPLAGQIHGALAYAQTAGRTAAFDAAPAAAKDAGQYIAVEIMDENTCGPCAAVDGTAWDSLADAAAEYPGGGYWECQGMDRCRGTLMALWGSGD